MAEQEADQLMADAQDPQAETIERRNNMQVCAMWARAFALRLRKRALDR